MRESWKLTRRGLVGVLAMSVTRAWAASADLLEIVRVVNPGPKPSADTHLRRYRVHATISLLSVPLFSKDNVGGACVMVEESIAGATKLSSIQFNSGSWPERLKGFNRFGMAQEVVREEEGSVAESAYLSFMTSSSETNLDQAKQSYTERANTQKLSVAHGRSGRQAYASSLDHLTAPQRATWADCPRLCVELQDRVSPLGQNITSEHQTSAYQPFLHTVRAAMKSKANFWESLFTHNAKLFRLRTKTTPGPQGSQMIGKIAECGTRQESEFRVWFDPHDASRMPQRFEFRPKSFLRLTFEQDDAISAPPFSSLIAQEHA